MAPGKTIYAVTGIAQSGQSAVVSALGAGGARVADGLPRPERGQRGRLQPLTPRDVDAVVGQVVKASPRQVVAIPDGRTVLVVFMRRDPAAVAAALETATEGRFGVNVQRRGRKPVEAVNDRVVRALGMLQDRPGVKVLDLSYEDVIVDPGGKLAEVAEFFGVDLDVDKAAAFIATADGDS